MDKFNKKVACWINRSLFLLVIVVFSAGLCKTLFFPKEIESYENRYANQFKLPTLNSYLDSTFQDNTEKALSDQVHLSTTAKKIYNDVNAAVMKQCISWFFSDSQNYITLKNIDFYHDYLMYSVRDMENVKEPLRQKAQHFNQVFQDNPNVDFYIYYIEKDTDINFENNQKPHLYEFFRDQVDLPDDHISRFQIDNFEQFSQYFYRTDHHWNYKGSYKGYTQVANMLGISDSDLITPVEEVDLNYSFSGSKASSSGITNVFTEPFWAYRFDYPPMTITENGALVDDFGAQNLYFSHQPDTISYGSFYGGDSGELVFDTHQEDRDDILIVGESYDNAILKLLAAHFNKTYSIDLRNYEAFMGQPFQFSQYLRDHDISKVLLIGNIDYFVMEEFMLRG
nr:DHHW family protein [uncultured Solibaculum sp.]